MVIRLRSGARCSSSFPLAMAWYADWETRFQRLIDDGLPCCFMWSSLQPGARGTQGWILRIEPLAPPAVWAPRAFDVYHLSIAQEGVPTAAELSILLRAFHGRSTTVRFSARRGGYLVLAGDIGANPVLTAVHARGWYAERELHVSM
jgi:hypothetical protein